MKRNTHIMVGFIPTAIVYTAVPVKPPIIVAILLSIVGSIFPDIDLKIGLLKHRGITHTIIFTLFTTYPIWTLLGYECGLIWLFAYSSHIFLDSLTVKGVPALYPVTSKMYGYRKFKTEGYYDNWIVIYFMFFGSAFLIRFLVNTVYRMIS